MSLRYRNEYGIYIYTLVIGKECGEDDLFGIILRQAQDAQCCAYSLRSHNNIGMFHEEIKKELHMVEERFRLLADRL